jgi:hypothetical protein
MQRQWIRLRQVNGNKLDAAIHEARDKFDVASEPIEFGDHAHRTRGLSSGESVAQARPVAVPAAFDLHKLLGHAVAVVAAEGLDG